VANLQSSRPDAELVINPDNRFIRIRPTIKFLNKQFSNLFAIGDITDTGAQKAAQPG
jgi:hypothetical protein